MTMRLPHLLLGCVLLLSEGGQAMAQSAALPGLPSPVLAASAQQGPLKLQRIRSGMVLAPDVRIADIDDVTGTFVGGYAGWLADERFLVGGAGYWLASPTDERDVAYFGAIVGWQVPVGDAVRFGARGLVGGGWATLLGSYDYYLPDRPWGPPRPNSFHGSGPGEVVHGRAYFSDDFFVFEPQVDVSIRFGQAISLATGVSYRVVAGAGDFDDRLRGVAGSIAVQFGVF